MPIYNRKSNKKNLKENLHVAYIFDIIIHGNSIYTSFCKFLYLCSARKYVCELWLAARKFEKICL